MTTEVLHSSPPAGVSQIARLIRATRLWLRTSWTATGLALTIGALTATLAVVALIDLVWPLSEWLRLAGLLIVVVPAAWLALHGVVRPLVRRLRAPAIARRIEQYLPGIQNRLVSCVELASGQRSGSPSFLQRLLAETLERIRPFRPRTVINRRDLSRACVFAAVGSATLFGAFRIFPDRLPTAIARILAPFADIAPATGVTYTVEPGDATVLRGDDVTFAAVVSRGEPDGMRLEIIVPDGSRTRTLWHDMQTDSRSENRWAFRLSGFEKSFQYRVYGGGTWSPQYQVTMLDRPRITGLSTILHYPAYMGLPEPQLNPPEVADVTGPVGSDVEVRVTVAGPATSGEIQLLTQQTRAVSVTSRPERVWANGRVPDGAQTEGAWEWDEKAAGGATHSNPAAPNGEGSHGFHNARTGFQVGRGDVLFAEVFLPADQTPETVMLQFHDGQNWEHRAFWGPAKIGGGNPDTASRRSMGPLPKAGEWIRLEVPARDVDLEGRMIRGITFRHFGGKCLWRRFGALPPATRDVTELIVEQRFPLEQQPLPADAPRETREGDAIAQWSGRFPLAKDGWYRVELRNAIDAANPPMEEAQITAIPDHPPHVAVERPGTDLVLSEPAKVPIFITSHDDFGLADLVLSVQKSESGGFVGRPVKHYETVTRSDSAAVTLDLAAEGIGDGQTLRYRVEARDRKGQSAQTRDYSIRIAANDGNAADKRMDAFEKTQESVAEKLDKLVTDQEAVREKVEQLAEKFEPLTEQIEAARQAAAEQAAATAPEGQPQKPEPPKLDSEAEKSLNELRQELSKLKGQQEQNTRLGEQTAGELRTLANKANELQTLPPEVAGQLASLAEAFPEAAVEPMKDLAETLQKSSQAAQSDPQLDDIQAASDRLQRDLEAIQARMQALAEAQKQSRTDAPAALAELRRKLTKQNASLAARELSELHETVADLRQDLEELGKGQAQLLEFTPSVPDLLVQDLERRQGELDARSDSRLADARHLLGDQRRRPRRAPAGKSEGSEGEAGDPKSEDSDAEVHADDEPLFVPALGGPPPRPDSRLHSEPALSQKPAETKEGSDAAEQRREELGTRQRQRLGELSQAEQSLGSDEETLDELLSELHEAADADPAELAELLGSEPFRLALLMAARLRQRSSPSEGQPNPAAAAQVTAAPSQALIGNLAGTPLADPEVLEQLDQLDPAARTVILQLQPKLREELLQGLKESGPEGYQQFIRDYFRRLAQAQAK